MNTTKEVNTLNFSNEDIEEVCTQNDSFKSVIKRYIENKYDLNRAEYLQKYPQITVYINELGEDRIKALGYQETKLKQAIKEKLGTDNVLNKICFELKKYDSQELTKDQIKDILTDLYTKYNVMNRGKLKAAKVTDLKLYGYNAQRKQTRKDNKVISYYLITKIQ